MLAYVKGFLRNGWGNQQGIENRVLRQKSTYDLPYRAGRTKKSQSGERRINVSRPLVNSVNEDIGSGMRHRKRVDVGKKKGVVEHEMGLPFRKQDTHSCVRLIVSVTTMEDG